MVSTPAYWEKGEFLNGVLGRREGLLRLYLEGSFGMTPSRWNFEGRVIEEGGECVRNGSPTMETLVLVLERHKTRK